MAPLALGLVETLGLVPAVEAADTAAKAAEIRLAGLECIGSGLVSVKILGDISSVKEGVAAARMAAERLGEVRSATVIGRTGDGVVDLISGSEPESGDSPEPVAAAAPAKEVPAADIALPALSKLSGMRVVALRKVARSLSQDFEEFPLLPARIKFARKKELVETIRAFARARKKGAEK